MRKIISNITYYSQQNIAAQRNAALKWKKFWWQFLKNAAESKAANYFEINKTNVEIQMVKIIAAQFSQRIRYRGNSTLHGKESKIKNRRRKIALVAFITRSAATVSIWGTRAPLFSPHSLFSRTFRSYISGLSSYMFSECAWKKGSDCRTSVARARRARWNF